MQGTSSGSSFLVRAPTNMAMQVLMLIFAAAVATASAGVGSVPVLHVEPDLMEDYDINIAYKTHLAVIELQKIIPPYHYSYGYDIFYEKTGETQGQFETRYGDVAVGTFFRVSAGGNRTTVEYTVDTPHGFQPSVRRDVQTQAESRGFARLAGPLAFASPPAPEGSQRTLLGDAEAAQNASPQAHSAYMTHHNTKGHIHFEIPFHVSWGYQMRDAQTGRFICQYEKGLGHEMGGRLIFLEADGTQTGLTISVNDTGYYVTSPATQATHVP